MPTFIPQVSYGPGPTILTFTHPLTPWGYIHKTVGGFGKSAAGVPEALLIRRERRLATTLTFYESQKTAVETWLEYIIDNAASFIFWLDKDNNATQYTVYLETPHMTEDVTITRHPDYIGAFTVEIVIRTVNNSRFTTNILA